MKSRTQNVTISISHLCFIALVIVVTLAGGFAQSAFAQEGTTVIPPPPPASGASMDETDPTRAFSPTTGQNFYWDCNKKTWIDSKTGKSAPGGFEGRRGSDGEVIPPPPLASGASMEETDPTRAFSPTTGQNMHWDPHQKTWKDSKTGQPVPGGFKGRRVNKACPPPADTGTTPPKTEEPKTLDIPFPTETLDMTLAWRYEKFDDENRKSYRVEACDIEFGYDYMRAPDESAKNLNGVGGSLFCNVKPWIAFGGDVSALFGSTTDTVGTIKFDTSLHRQTYLFGPQFNFYPKDRVKIFIQGLAGVVHDTGTTTIGTTSVNSSTTAFVVNFGVGVDVKLNNHFFVRAGQVAYTPTFFGGKRQDNLRFSIGFGYGFGHHGSAYEQDTHTFKR